MKPLHVAWLIMAAWIAVIVTAAMLGYECAAAGAFIVPPLALFAWLIYKDGPRGVT